ncbi:MAG: hypothetical protein EA349_13330 [Halomonadaceae bacterium]|nr:MAG: hypothetical protein EA349_13330 [Halomonadaceae bacterium]
MNNKALSCKWLSSNACVTRSALFVALASVTWAVQTSAAGLQPMSEEAMAGITGQAALGFDIIETADADFSRFTLGMEVEVQTNIDTLAFGEDANGAADVGINHFALGHIARADGVQFDGKSYSANDIVPFVGLDPYFELAEKDGNIQGFRFGFSESRGTVSGDIDTLSGQIGMELVDSEGNVQAGQMLRSDGSANTHRATHFGLAGEGTDCAAGNRCTELSNLQTLEVGQRRDDGTADFTRDFFISFQKEDTEWVIPNSGGQTIQTQAGVFFNLPTAMRMELQQLQTQGLPRARTEFIDRGENLF